jgi:parvulin-like peptidyl-prolyl isomerase
VRRFLPLVLLAGMAVLPACKRQGGGVTLSGDETVLQVGDKIVTLREFKDGYERAKLERGIAGDSQGMAALKNQLVAETIKQELILARGREKGMTVSAEEVAAEIAKIRSHYPGDSFREMLAEQYVAYDEWIERQKTRLLVEKVVADEIENKITVADDEAKAWLQQHPDIAAEPEKIHLQQILVSTEEEAKLIKSRLDRGEDFAGLAKEKSISPEGKDGGDLGTYTRDDVPTGMDVAFNLKPGVPSDVVQSEYGFHIFRVTEHSGARTLGWDEVKPKVIEAIKAEKTEAAFPAWLQGLASGVKVYKNDAILAAIE